MTILTFDQWVQAQAEEFDEDYDPTPEFPEFNLPPVEPPNYKVESHGRKDYRW